MARIEDLIEAIPDPELKASIRAELAHLKRERRFGLVFERHIPELAYLDGFPIRANATVRRRAEAPDAPLWRVLDVDGRIANIEPANGGEVDRVDLEDLHVVKRFGEPVFPSLEATGSVTRGGDKPSHAVINGENYHALQLLLHLYEGEVDCIYIDPPYNSGARDWKYNNNYVDANDAWRHSKWLSMMEKRLRLARRLLKSDGVLIVTIDENEVYHLGCLLEELFPHYLLQMVTIVINPKGTGKLNLSRVDEHAIFCCPDIGRSVIQPRLVSEIAPDEGPDVSDPDGLLIGLDDPYREELDLSPPPVAEEEMIYLRRRGAESSYRHQRPNQFYAIYVDESEQRVLGVGPSLGPDESPEVTREGDTVSYYPIDNEGHHRVWAYIPPTMQKYIDDGAIVLGGRNKQTSAFTLWRKKPKKQTRQLKTVWWDKSHDAGTHGTTMLYRILGKRGIFPFPKSVYAVRDCLAAVCRDRPDALIVDFFAGSGTTLHATSLLNAADDGRRRCVLVTNNEVDQKTAAKLRKDGFSPGDPEYEAHGIYAQATEPRCRAVITGERPDGQPIPGKHVGGRPFADGFEENLRFYQLKYVDPDLVDLGTQYSAIAWLLWLSAGGVGEPDLSPSDYMSLPPTSNYGVLFDEARIREFCAALGDRADVSHVWLVTDSEESYAEMLRYIGPDRFTSMLYRDYLESFGMNVAQ